MLVIYIECLLSNQSFAYIFSNEVHSSLFQEKYLSEHNYEEQIDEDSTLKLLNFGDDYRKFIDSMSEGDLSDQVSISQTPFEVSKSQPVLQIKVKRSSFLCRNFNNIWFVFLTPGRNGSRIASGGGPCFTTHLCFLDSCICLNSKCKTKTQEETEKIHNGELYNIY